MFRHVVMFRWAPEVSGPAKAAVATRLAELPNVIDTIRGYRFGPDAGLADGNWDFVVVADFADAGGYLAYRDHEAHQAVIAERIKPIVAERAAVQYSIAD